ncbi:MAG: UDP-galactopyranose mutase [Oscillospiraceae bacterium]|nr:UDP-galactopyranose mutase [Oscillospiraceae bacterium]
MKNRKSPYDCLIVGAGLFGSVCARELTDAGKKVLVVEKRSHIGGNVYTEKRCGIHVHRYGPHIFHTNDEEVWNYVRRFAGFNAFINRPLANCRGELYSLPFSMHTFRSLWGVTKPEEARAEIDRQRAAVRGEPQDLEEQAIALVGRDCYEKLIRGYTEKQWGRACSDLPASIIRRIPVRFTWNDNYYDALYQGIPIGGYTAMVEKLLHGIDVRTDTDYDVHRGELDPLAEKILYTGPIDAFYDYRCGCLEYRSETFETEYLDRPDYQGNAVVHYTEREIPWTRITEHKWFTFGRDDAGKEIPGTIITREYSREWKRGEEAFYPVRDAKNKALLSRYRALAEKETKVVFGGRLGEYRYLDMDQSIASALACVKNLFRR